MCVGALRACVGWGAPGWRGSGVGGGGGGWGGVSLLPRRRHVLVAYVITPLRDR